MVLHTERSGKQPSPSTGAIDDRDKVQGTARTDTKEGEVQERMPRLGSMQQVKAVS